MNPIRAAQEYLLAILAVLSDCAEHLRIGHVMNNGRKRILGAVAALSLLAAACGGVDAESTIAAPAADSSGSSGMASGSAPEASGSDEGLEWASIDFGCDFIDDVEARGRVTNSTSSDIGGAAFTITVLQGGSIVATLTGFVDSLAVGATKTVEFISTDDCLEGDFEYDIQTDFAFEGGGSSSGGSVTDGGAGDSDGSLVWSMIDFGCDFVDDVEARGRVENTGSEEISSAAFTITVIQGGSIVATLTGFVGSLAPGQTKTVEFISTDDCLEGDFEYDVQTDFAF